MAGIIRDSKSTTALTFDDHLKNKNTTVELLQATWPQTLLTGMLKHTSDYMQILINIAAEHNNVIAIEWLINKWKEDHPRVPYHFADPFVAAAGSGHNEAVKFFLNYVEYPYTLIDHRHSINRRTALMSAADGGHLVTVKLLVASGAMRETKNHQTYQVNPKAPHAEMALTLAAKKDHIDIVRYLAPEYYSLSDMKLCLSTLTTKSASAEYLQKCITFAEAAKLHSQLDTHDEKTAVQPQTGDCADSISKLSSAQQSGDLDSMLKLIDKIKINIANTKLQHAISALAAPMRMFHKPSQQMLHPQTASAKAAAIPPS